jgi:hypothetical protein
MEMNTSEKNKKVKKSDCYLSGSMKSRAFAMEMNTSELMRSGMPYLPYFMINIYKIYLYLLLLYIFIFIFVIYKLMRPGMPYLPCFMSTLVIINMY